MDPFGFEQYEFRRKSFSVIHTDFFLHAPAGDTFLYGRKKGFGVDDGLEDIRLYADAGLHTELLSIAAGVVSDSRERRTIGLLRRKELRSMRRGQWQILDLGERPLAIVQEDSAAKAFLRRFLTNHIPQSFHITMNDSAVAEIHQHLNPFPLRLSIDFRLDSRRALDRRLGLAAVLLATLEGRESD